MSASQPVKRAEQGVGLDMILFWTEYVTLHLDSHTS